MKPLILFQGDNIQITLGDKVFMVNRNTNSRFDEIMEALEREDFDTVATLSDPARALAQFYSSSSEYTLDVFGNKITLNGERLARALESRLMDMYEAGLPMTPIVNFLERVHQNPSASAVRELYLYLENNNLPLTMDGYFMAYKSVRAWDGDTVVDEFGRPFADGDFQSIGLDSDTGLPTRIRVGEEIRRPRNTVDDNRHNYCSFGFHFANLDYASTWSYWDAVVLMKVDPADVVAFPPDCSGSKGRTCAYTPVEIHADNRRPDGEDVPEAFTSPIYDDGNALRWEVRNSRGDLLSSHKTRDEARSARRDRHGVEGTYLRDALTGDRIR